MKFIIRICTTTRKKHLTNYLDHHKFDAIGVSIIAGYYQYKKLLDISRAIEQSRQRPEYYIIGGHGPSPEAGVFSSTKPEPILSS